MNKYKSEEEYNYTKISGGKYNIKEDEYDIFFEEYNKSSLRDLTERHLEDKSKLLIDIDLKRDNYVRTITNQDIRRIINIINDTLDVLFINPNKECYVFQRPSPYKKDNYYKDGIHIIYPYIVTYYELLYLIRRSLLKDLKWLESHSYESIDLIIDESVIKKNNWFLYKSTKPNTIAYEITNIYNNNGEIIKNNKSDIELIKLFSIRYKLEIIECIYDKNHIINIYNNIEKIDTKEDNNIKSIDDNIQEREKIRYMLLNIIDIKRTDNYKEWLNIGLCLHNINENYLDLWIEFSKRSEKYKIGECEKLWKKFTCNDANNRIYKYYKTLKSVL